MSLIQLPHSADCLVCGRANPVSLGLSLHVDPVSGLVRTRFEPASVHVGFDGIVHGGATATVLDEAMVWAASWAARRFCVCGELTVRYRQAARVGVPLDFVARVESARRKMVLVTAEALNPDGVVVASAAGKYVPVSDDQHAVLVRGMLREPATDAALQWLLPRG